MRRVTGENDKLAQAAEQVFEAVSGDGDRTPVRSLGMRSDEGWILLRDSGNPYLDGGENRVFELVQDAKDLGSLSDELIGSARGWSEEYHLDPTRANILRTLDLPPDAVVLEIGAGCGAITRYLGEACAVVDAVEPVEARARVARVRTRDLAGVEVYVGTLEDVPPTEAYDLVVVIGGLEYVGSGILADEPYRAFLQRVHQVLKPGGQLILAIENKLGVKYLSGAPEDHSGIPFDSVEGYPGSSPARTFSRSELTALMASAGLDSTSKVAFPDYKTTRAVFDPEQLSGSSSSLLWRVPVFPSPDRGHPAFRTSSEALSWRSFVQAGLASEVGNSFLAIASKGSPTHRLWDANLAGVYFSTFRRKSFTTKARITTEGHDVVLTRTLLGDGGAVEGPHVEGFRESYVQGDDFYDVFVDTDDPRSLGLLSRWVEIVDEMTSLPGPTPIDVIPRNLVVGADDVVVAIDGEWRDPSADRWAVLGRGALLAAQDLVARGHTAGRWAGCTVLKDIALRIGEAVGLGTVGDWLEKVVEDEARLLSIVLVPDAAHASEDSAAAEEHHRALISASLDLPVGSAAEDGPVPVVGAEASLDALKVREELQAVRRELMEAVGRASWFESEKAATERLLRTASEQLLEAETGNAQVLVAANHEYQALEQRLDETQKALAETQSQLAEMHERTERAAAETAALDHTLEATRATVSWRVTAPLRSVRRRLP